MTLLLDTRQRAMLSAMGVRVWMPAATHPTAPVKLVTPAAPVETTAPSIVLKALPAGLADMDWPALEQAAASCQACGL
ncbi:MAG: hypothetical protein RL763_1228, partial [Pseudomonadota bacterium]